MFANLPRWPGIFLLIAICVIADGNRCAAQPRAKNGRRSRDVSLFARQFADRRGRFATSLEQIAAECDALGLDIAAGEIRSLAAPVESAELRLAPLPREVQPSIPQ